MNIGTTQDPSTADVVHFATTQDSRSSKVDNFGATQEPGSAKAVNFTVTQDPGNDKEDHFAGKVVLGSATVDLGGSSSILESAPSARDPVETPPPGPARTGTVPPATPFIDPKALIHRLSLKF